MSTQSFNAFGRDVTHETNDITFSSSPSFDSINSCNQSIMNPFPTFSRVLNSQGGFGSLSRSPSSSSNSPPAAKLTQKFSPLCSSPALLCIYAPSCPLREAKLVLHFLPPKSFSHSLQLIVSEFFPPQPNWQGRGKRPRLPT